MLYLNKVDEVPKKVDQLLAEMTIEAWKIGRISNYFQSLGFSFEDYDAMFRAAFFTCPQAKIEPNLAVTVLMIDECNKIDIFRGIAKAIANESNRKEASARLVADWVKKAYDLSPNKPK